MFVRSDILTLSRAEDEYQLNDINQIVQRIERIVITTINSTRVKAFFNFKFSLGFKKLSFVIIFFQVFCSNSFRAFFATAHHLRAGVLFCSSHFVCIVSAICLVDNSAKAVKINSASLI